MKIKVTFKDPQALDEITDSGTRAELESWFRWCEYVDLEVDTEKDTCEVIRPIQ